MRVIGLTGNIAAGKSTVANWFAAWGATLIDADQLARTAVVPGSPGLDAIVARWGPTMLAPDGSLDRAALRRIVFADPAARAALDAIVHPEVGRLRDLALAEARQRGDRLVICDIPLLFEAGLADTVEDVVLVDAPRAERRARLMRDRGLSAADAEAMLDAQWPAERKRPLARWIIDNDGDLGALEIRARGVYAELDRPR